jgi:hypothetical protein
MLEGVWQEMDYDIDVFHVTKGEHLESLQTTTQSFTVPVSKYISLYFLTIIPKYTFLKGLTSFVKTLYY